MSSVLNIVVALMDFHSGSDITVHKNVQRERFQTICAKLTCAAAQQNNTQKKTNPYKRDGFKHTKKGKTEDAGVLPRVGGACAAPCPASNTQQCLCSPSVTPSCNHRLWPRIPHALRSTLQQLRGFGRFSFSFLFLLSFFLSLFLLSSFFYVPLS